MQNLNTQVQVSHMKIINKIIQVNSISKCIRKNSNLIIKKGNKTQIPLLSVDQNGYLQKVLVSVLSSSFLTNNKHKKINFLLKTNKRNSWRLGL